MVEYKKKIINLKGGGKRNLYYKEYKNGKVIRVKKEEAEKKGGFSFFGSDFRLSDFKTKDLCPILESYIEPKTINGDNSVCNNPNSVFKRVEFTRSAGATEFDSTTKTVGCCLNKYTQDVTLTPGADKANSARIVS